MDAPALIETIVQIVLGFALGLAFGSVHFATLHRVTRLFLQGGAFGRAVALQLARLLLLATLMVALALIGIAAVLAGMFGVVAAREIVLRQVRKAG